MRHGKLRNKLGRDSAHRKALLKNLSKELLEHERIRTTEAKAKAVKPEVEKLITLAKRGNLHAFDRPQMVDDLLGVLAVAVWCQEVGCLVGQ